MLKVHLLKEPSICQPKLSLILCKKQVCNLTHSDSRISSIINFYSDINSVCNVKLFHEGSLYNHLLSGKNRFNVFDFD